MSFVNLIPLGFFGSLIVGGCFAVAGGIYRDKRWYAYPWAIFLAIPVAWLLKVFGILLTPVSGGESGGWQGFAKMFVLIALFPPLPALIALIIRRPAVWKKGAASAGLVFLAMLLTAAHFIETRPISLHVRDVTGKPMVGWVIEVSVSSPYGRPSVFELSTDANGEASFRADKGTSVGLQIHRPFGTAHRPDPLEEAQWIDLNIVEARDQPGTTISARWQTSYGAGQVSEYTYESVESHLKWRPDELVIPVITRNMAQPLNLGYPEAWSKVWPGAEIADNTLKTLVSVPEQCRKLSLSSASDRREVDELARIARQLFALKEIIRVIDYLPPKSEVPSPQNKLFYDEIGMQGRLLCEYLTGNAMDTPEERLAALRGFLTSRADQLMATIEPWMQQGREAYSILDAMRGLARPASKKFAAIYPGADRDTQEAMLRTFYPLGPAPEDILFVLDEASEKSLHAFCSAMRSRPKVDIDRDWAVFQNWLRENPGKLTEQQITSIRDGFQERANR